MQNEIDEKLVMKDTKRMCYAEALIWVHIFGLELRCDELEDLDWVDSIGCTSEDYNWGF